ncbi:hypothetical protein FRC07_008848, partial [Ceratobasidium sp. 392]
DHLTPVTNATSSGCYKEEQTIKLWPHKAVDNAEVEKLLQPESLVPTENAFLRRLHPFGFDFFKIFVVDLLHEIELGVWKSLLTHLLRILHSRGSNVVAEFNERFRQVPTFSNSTIRKFSEDVASLKRLAARDLEDILQCCMPVFKGLMPESIDSQVQHLLFTLAYWHGLAKLRQHTSATLKKLSEVTIQLGDELRAFQDTTKDMEVLETPREFAARQQKAAARTQRQRTTDTASVQVTRKVCKLNLNTPKFHAVGHYVSIIARYGTTDSFSTQSTELQHQKIKAQWHRTNMRDAISQMTRIGDIGDALDAIQDRLNKLTNHNPSSASHSNSQDLVDSSQAYGIGQSQRPEDAVNILFFIQANCQEPAVKFFTLLLKQHLLGRITGNSESLNLRDLTIVDDRMYEHATLHVNYTSYDVRRQYDVVKPNSSCPFILLPNDTTEDPSAHPFLYAKVLGIYHARAYHEYYLLLSLLLPEYRESVTWTFYGFDGLTMTTTTPAVGSLAVWIVCIMHGAGTTVNYKMRLDSWTLSMLYVPAILSLTLIPVVLRARSLWGVMTLREIGNPIVSTGHLNQHAPTGQQTEYALDNEDQELEIKTDEYKRLDEMDETADGGDEAGAPSEHEGSDSDTGDIFDDDDDSDIQEGNGATDEDEFIEDLYDL